MPPKYNLHKAILESQQLNPLEQMSMFAPAVYDMMSIAPVSSDPKKERKQTELDAKTRSMTTQTSFADPQVLSRLIEATNPFKAQKMGILNQYDTLKEDLKRPVQTDLSPLLAMADRMSGGATLKAYDRPQNSGELMDRIRSHLMGIQKSRNEYQDNLTNQINSIKAGQTQQLSEALMKTLAGTQAQNQAQNRAREDSRLREKDFNTQVEHLEKRYGDHTGKLISMITDLDSEIGGIDNWDGKADIPGIAAVNTRAGIRLPSKMTADFMLAGKDLSVRKKAALLSEELLRIQTGSAATDAEYKRLGKMLGDSITSDDRSFAEAFKNVRTTLAAKMRQHESAFPPSVSAEYARRVTKDPSATSWSSSFYGAPRSAPAQQPSAPQNKAPSFEEFQAMRRGKK